MAVAAKILALDFEVAPFEVSNFDLEKILDTSDEWISTRTGIKKRRVAQGSLTSTDLAIKAALKTVKRCDFDVDDIDLIISATSAPEDIYPSVSCLVQRALDAKNAAAFDLRAACSGFIYSLNVARAFIESGIYKNILIVATDTTTKNTDWHDRSTCVLFGDGAGAVLVSACENDNDIIGIDLMADGSVSDYITLKNQKETSPLVESLKNRTNSYIQMKGREVYKFVMQLIPPTLEDLLNRTNTDIDEIDYFVPHQSNQRMIEALAQRLNLPDEKVISNIENYGNMSAASIIVAIREGIDSGKIKLPGKFMLSAFGAGMTAANAIIKLEKNI